MKNEGKTDKVNEQIKEILYIEMIGQQMETIIEIDNIIKSGQKQTTVSKHHTF